MTCAPGQLNCCPKANEGCAFLPVPPNSSKNTADRNNAELLGMITVPPATTNALNITAAKETEHSQSSSKTSAMGNLLRRRGGHEGSGKAIGDDISANVACARSTNHWHAFSVTL